VNVPAALQIGGFRGNSNYNINVQSLQLRRAYIWAPKLEEAMAQVPEVQDVSDNMDLKSPRVSMTIDRDKAAALGLNATQITQTLSDAFGQRLVGTIYGERTQFRVLLEIDPRYQQRPESLKKISFRTPQGGLVPLEQIRPSRKTWAPERQPRRPAAGRQRVVRPEAGRTGAAIDHINQVAKRVLPGTVTTSLQ
jgi:multidrug efflux pump subunit AcrB